MVSGQRTKSLKKRHPQNIASSKQPIQLVGCGRMQFSLLAIFAVAGTQRAHKNKTTAGPVGRRDGPIPAVEGKTAILDKRRDPFYMQ